MSGTNRLADRLHAGTIDRRHLVGGAAGVATAATAAFALGSFVSAQSATTATATPEAGSGGSGTGNSASTQDGTAITTRSAAIIAAVKADRDALASSLDTAPIDELLSLASDLQTKAEAASVATGTGRRSSKSSSSGSTSSDTTSSNATPDASSSSSTTTSSATASTIAPGKIELAFAAARTAQAARATIVAQLANFGLPSEQARLSRGLAQIYADVKQLASDASSAKVEDASTLVSHAEASYKSAYDAYTAKTYASATAYGEATAHLGEAAAMLLGLRRGRAMGGGFGGMEMFGRDERGSGGRMNGGRGGNSQSGEQNADDSSAGSDGTTATPSAGTSADSETETTDDPSTPVDVPAPSF